MKAELNYHGMLIISPENVTEVYALKKWKEEAGISDESNGAIAIDSSHLIIELKVREEK